ncbi:MAG TPA: DUF2255 family protein [Microbacterium sp.]|nr:DUF2255 family protein [Microbacterium sp.]
MDLRAPGESWSAEELRYLDETREVEIAAARAPGRPGRWTTIWVVVANDEVLVRTWRRRTTGWYGGAVASGRARIAVAGGSVDVVVEITGDADVGAVDAAYRAKYGSAGAESMVAAEAAASTLRLTRAA